MLQEFHKENHIKNDSNNHFPYSQNGDKDAFLVASESMGIPVLDQSNSTGNLITWKRVIKQLK